MSRMSSVSSKSELMSRFTRSAIALASSIVAYWFSALWQEAVSFPPSSAFPCSFRPKDHPNQTDQKPHHQEGHDCHDDVLE